jgi:hypothetical protein
MLEPRSRLARLAVPIVLILTIAACGSSSGTAPAGGTATAAAASAGIASGATPTDASEGAPSGAPSEAPTEAPPSEALPSGEPSTSPSGSPDAGAAAACTGSDDNRQFFADAAAAVDWTVLCAVLPTGWFVAKGVYRGNAGGKVLVSYSGRNGLAATISQGAWCTEPDGCVLDGTEIGPTKLGPMDGTLIKVGAKDYQVVVDKGQPISWLFEAVGMGQQKAVALAAAATVVGD